MESRALFDQTFSQLEKSMNLRSQKHDLLVSNIANADTPNFKAFDIMVEEEMQKSSGKTGLQMVQSQPAHLSLNGTSNAVAPEIREVPAPRYNFRNDGNTVDMDKNMLMLAENGLLYNASAQMISKKFQLLTSAINGTVR